MQKIPFHRKRPEASDDYQLAYSTINDIKPGKSVTLEPENVAAFRKYAYDLAAKQGKNIATRIIKPSGLIISCLF